jgi:Uma2 family endonuclease
MQLASPPTIDAFERLPSELAQNHELVDGKLVDASGNTLGHNRLRDYVTSLLREYVKKNGLGEVVSRQEFDFGANAQGPDVTFAVAEKIAGADDRRRVRRFVPDLAIEIVSENDTFKKFVKKADRYRDTDVRSSLIPGFSIRLGGLFHQI